MLGRTGTAHSKRTAEFTAAMGYGAPDVLVADPTAEV